MNRYKLDYQKRPATVVTFRLTGDDLQPDIITQALGVAPHRAWAKGDVRSKTKNGDLLFTFGCWSLVPQADRHDKFEDQLLHLLDLLETLPPVLHEFVTQYHAEISVGHSSGEYNFGFSIDKEMLERLCKLGISLDFDIYAVGDKNNDKETTNNQRITKRRSK